MYDADDEAIDRLVAVCGEAGMEVAPFTKEYPGRAFDDGYQPPKKSYRMLTDGYYHLYRGKLHGVVI